MKDREQTPRRPDAQEKLGVAIAPLAILALAVAVGACGKRSHDVVAEVEQAAPDSADQLMIGLTQYMTQDGVRQAKLLADSAYVYENSGHVELKRVNVTFYSTSGVQTSVLTARDGTYNMRNGKMEARGNCVVVMTDGGRLTSEVLRYDQAKNEVSTDRPFVYDRADRHIEGSGLVSDPTFANIVTQKPHGTAGRFTLPGQ